ncbi:YhgE/Pip domain-containing protein [Mycetocola tolaasinivorans]|uniref:YhgE/Pip domain-containing protein n=2 Tax=Mycetocola tolaasinivorans TaxID=76635 RepID=A0A3L7A4U8_9MICO|nr:YhgE/Pip domain-containing protein [Mycetocola tolaasinivorans]
MSFASAGTELTRFKKGTLPKISLVVLLFIPLIYGALYLWAFWAPTDEMKNLPVAIVNEDRGATLEDGTRLDAGTRVVDKVLEGGDLKWSRVDADTARKGVSDGTYYFSVTVPKDFSAAAASVADETPKQAKLDVEFNDANNFLASTLGQSAMTLLRNAVTEQVSAQTANTMLVGVNTLADGVRQAADGAGTLADGAHTLNDGAGELVVGLNSLADGSGKLSDGAHTLANGTDTLGAGTKTLADGIGKAATGAGTLAGGAHTLSDGLGQLAGKTPALGAGAAELQLKSKDLPAQASALNDGAQALSDGVGALHVNADKTAQLAAGIQQALTSDATQNLTVAQLNAMLAANGIQMEKLTGATAGISAATAGDSKLAAGASGLAAGTAKLSASAPALQQGIGTLAAGAAGVNDAVQQLSGGAGTLTAGADTLASSLNEAVPGANKLADGARTLNTGAHTLASSSTQLADGARTAADGGVTLTDGTQKLADGSGELAGKLGEGAEKAPDYSTARIDRTADVVANPVALATANENKAASFGEGFAPFFIALAAFVGALITWLILRALPTRALAGRTSGMRAALTGFIPAAAIGLGQVVIMMLVLVYGIGLQPVYWVATAAFMYLTTLAFLALQQMFIVLFGSATGRVVSLVLLMLQLSSSGGTYPVETTPGFFQVLHPLMPATYVVNGLRQLITGGVDARFWIALAYMIGLLLISFAISAYAAGRQKVWTMKRLSPELAI